MANKSPRGYQVGFTVDEHSLPFSPHNTSGPYLRISITSGDHRHDDQTQPFTAIECHVTSESFHGDSMLAVVHCEDEKDIRFHNPYRRQNISRTEYDPDTTFPLVLGPQGTLSASVRTALQLVSHDGSIHLPAGSSMNPTDSDFHISERFVWEQFLRGLRRSGFDTIADLGILAGGKGERRAWVPGEDQCRLEVTPLHFPIVVHRSSRALISTSSLTVSQLYKAFQNHELEATGVRGLSDDDIERFFDLLNRESAVKALGGSQSAQEAKTKSKNTPPQHEKPKLVRRMQRYIGRV